MAGLGAQGAGRAQAGAGRWAGRWALGWALGAGRWAARRLRAERAGRARQASVSGRAGEREWGVQARSAGAQGRAERRRAGTRGAQAGRRQRARQAQACAGHWAWARGARGVGARGAQAGHAGWSAGLVLVHSAPGSVLTQFSVPFDSVFS